MIKNGANVSAVDIMGKTALHVAAQNGKEKVADFLIKNGTNVDVLDINGKTPLLIAAKYGKFQNNIFALSSG